MYSYVLTSVTEKNSIQSIDAAKLLTLKISVLPL